MTLSLRRRADFGRVLREGRRARQHALAVAARPNELGVVRVGYAVGRRVGGAVVRNLVRRRLRSLIRTAVPAELARPDGDPGAPASSTGWDIVVTAFEGSSTTPFDALAGQLASALGAALSPGSRKSGGARPSGSPGTR